MNGVKTRWLRFQQIMLPDNPRLSRPSVEPRWWRLVTWPGVTDCCVFLPRVPGYLLFFSDPSQLATKVREADLFSAAQPIFLCLARVQKSPHKFMLTSYMKYLVNTSRRFATSSSVQCLPGDRVMTPPLHCPTDTQDTATTGIPHRQSLDNIPGRRLLDCLHFYYKEVRPTWQKLNSSRRDQIGCILNHHIKNSRSLGRVVCRAGWRWPE